MLTSKYDNLVPIDAALPEPVAFCAPRLRRVAEAVRRRCGVDAWVDRWRHDLCFGHQNGGDTRVVFSWPVFKHFVSQTPCRFEITDGDDISIEDICYAIQIGRVDPARKAQWLRSIRESADNDKRERHQRTAHESVRAHSKDAARAVEKAKMGKHYRGSALVNGTKEKSWA